MHHLSLELLPFLFVFDPLFVLVFCRILGCCSVCCCSRIIPHALQVRCFLLSLLHPFLDQSANWVRYLSIERPVPWRMLCTGSRVTFV